MSHFDRDRRSVNGVLNDLLVFRQEGIDIIELFGAFKIKEHHLQGTDLKASLKDHVDDFPDLLALYDVRVDDA